MHYVACKKVINAMEIIKVEQGKGDLGSGKKGGVGYSIKQGGCLSLGERLLSVELYNVREEFIRQKKFLAQRPYGRSVSGLFEKEQESNDGGKGVKEAESITR